jgi:hypothetical protein
MNSKEVIRNPYIEDEQTTQWLKEKVQKDKQRNVLLMVSVFNNFSVMSIVINRYIRERTDMMN